MRIELTEVLRCPRCTSTAGLVALIEQAVGSRILEGALGCPFCEARYPVRASEVDLTGAESEPAVESQPVGVSGYTDPRETERVLSVAALLGLHEGGGGFVLLDEALGTLAERVEELAPGQEIIVLLPSGGALPESETTARSGVEGRSTSRVRIDPGAELPVLAGRLRGIALHGPDTERLRDAARALHPGGRLVVFDPKPAMRDKTTALGLRLLAADATALVAIRDAGSS